MVNKISEMNLGELRAMCRRSEDALKMIAGEVDSCGFSHGSQLHDLGHVGALAVRVLEGKDPHDALQEIG